MSDETMHVPLALAVAVVSVAAVLLISLAITAVFFDKAGYLRRFKSPRVLNSPGALVNGSGRRPAPPARTPNREPWGKQR